MVYPDAGRPSSEAVEAAVLLRNGFRDFFGRAILDGRGASPCDYSRKTEIDAAARMSLQRACFISPNRNQSPSFPAAPAPIMAASEQFMVKSAAEIVWIEGLGCASFRDFAASSRLLC